MSRWPIMQTPTPSQQCMPGKAIGLRRGAPHPSSPPQLAISVLQSGTSAPRACAMPLASTPACKPTQQQDLCQHPPAISVLPSGTSAPSACTMPLASTPPRLWDSSRCSTCIGGGRQARLCLPCGFINSRHGQCPRHSAAPQLEVCTPVAAASCTRTTQISKQPGPAAHLVPAADHKGIGLLPARPTRLVLRQWVAQSAGGGGHIRRLRSEHWQRHARGERVPSVVHTPFQAACPSCKLLILQCPTILPTHLH